MKSKTTTVEEHFFKKEEIECALMFRLKETYGIDPENMAIEWVFITDAPGLVELQHVRFHITGTKGPEQAEASG